jgi:DeoR family transcriptional regulator, glycerol-3-phosphate regulon repressor
MDTNISAPRRRLDAITVAAFLFRRLSRYTLRRHQRVETRVALSFRQTEILDIARSEGRVVVDTLAERFNVTLQTIRRDLTDLADAGLLDRVHGGAVMRTGVSNIGYEERRRMNEGAKAAIARACAQAIPDNCSMILNLGTTTEAVARELLTHRNITVVTNNMNVANILVANDSCEIMVAGGGLRRSDGGLVGELTTQFFEQFKVDYAIIGCSAMDRDGDLLDFDMAEVRVSKAIIRQSRTRYLVTDASKMDRPAPVRLASLSELDGVFTDRPLPDALMTACKGWNTDVHVAGPQDQGAEPYDRNQMRK